MTPKEKAVELLNKYIPHTKLWHEVDGWIECKDAAKQCALIAVGNEEEGLDRFAEYWDLKNGEWYADEIDKLNQKKQEIENL